jgi:hypothetical protein
MYSVFIFLCCVCYQSIDPLEPVEGSTRTIYASSSHLVFILDYHVYSIGARAVHLQHGTAIYFSSTWLQSECFRLDALLLRVVVQRPFFPAWKFRQ